MLGCFDYKYSLHFFYMTERGRQCKYVINILSRDYRLEITIAIFQPFIFKTAAKMLARGGPSGDPIAAPSIYLWNLMLNMKKLFFVHFIKQITKTLFRILGVLSLLLYKL